ncbi:hypothetical protein U1Q18_015272 [Sarracenia purpurea var. burkii]
MWLLRESDATSRVLCRRGKRRSPAPFSLPDRPGQELHLHFSGERSYRKLLLFPVYCLPQGYRRLRGIRIFNRPLTPQNIFAFPSFGLLRVLSFRDLALELWFFAPPSRPPREKERGIRADLLALLG